MLPDLVKRLRVMARWETPTVDYGCDPTNTFDHSRLEREAADRIERLEAALRDVIATTHHDHSDGPPPRYVQIARAAIRKETGDG